MFKYALLFCALYVCFAAFAPVKADTVWDILSNQTEVSKFFDIIVKANDTDLNNRLKSNSANTTIFAPTNDAITTAGDLAFVDYTVVFDKAIENFENGQILYTELSLASLANATQVVKVTVAAGKATVNGDSDVTTTWNATNGQVHVVSKNLTLPVSFSTILEGTSFSTLKALLGAANLSIDGTAQTVFAPTDDAFKALPTWITNYLQAGGLKDQLPKILLNHVVDGTVLYAYGQSGVRGLKSVEGSPLVLNFTAAGATVNGVKISTADVLAASGVAHVVDQVLVPEDVQFSVVDVLEGLGQTDFIAALKTTALYALLDTYIGNYTVFPAQPFSVKDSAPVAYHVVAGALTAAQLQDGQLLTSYYLRNGEAGIFQMLKVTIADGKVYINGVEVVTPDNIATNGVVHVLKNPISKVPGNIASLLTGDFSELGKAVGLAGLTNAFEANASYTVFAPKNSAFAALHPALAGYLFLNTTHSNAQLSLVLQYHAMSMLKYSSDIVPPVEFAMLDGQKINITKDNTTLWVNKVAKIVAVDALASNGVVHTIDQVLVPENLTVSVVDLIDGAKATTFYNYLNKTKVLALLTNGTNLTVFAPSNDAFKNLDSKDKLDKMSTTDLSKVLRQHIVNTTISTLKNATYTSLTGSKIVVYQSGNDWYVNINGAKTKAGKISPGSSTYGAQSAYLYPIDQVLGEEDASSDDDDGGLTSTEVGLIVAGCIVAVLLAGAAIGGGVWYYKRRHGYEQIDADTTF